MATRDFVVFDSDSNVVEPPALWENSGPGAIGIVPDYLAGMFVSNEYTILKAENEEDAVYYSSILRTKESLATFSPLPLVWAEVVLSGKTCGALKCHFVIKPVRPRLPL